MDYLDFELRVASGSGPDYSVSVNRSPAGEAKGTLRLGTGTLPLQSIRSVLDGASRGSSVTRDLTVAGDPPPSASELGRALFDALLTGDVLAGYRSSLRHAREARKGLRLRLQFGDPDVGALPWELLFDPTTGDFVGLSSATPIVRDLDVDRSREPIAIQPPLRVLGMVAGPRDRPPLDSECERRRMMESTSELRRAGLLQIDWLEGGTWRDLQVALQRGTYHVFHFIGHAGFDAARGEGVLAFEGELGETALFGATEIGRLLADHFSLRLAVLNACLGARGNTAAPFSSTASVLVRRGLPAVVAMQHEISDRAAVEFSRSFYTAVANGKPVDESVTEARKAMSFGAGASIEWATPVLHLRSPDGRLFAIDTLQRLRRPDLEPLFTSESGRRNRRSVLDAMRTETTARLPSPGAPGAVIEIKTESQPHQVVRQWDAEVTLASAVPPPLPQGLGVLDTFDHPSVAGRLLILGGPGAGKSTSLLQLARVLTQRADEDAAAPIPVLVSLSSWTADKKEFTDWLLDELRRKFGIRQTYGRMLMGGGVLAVLFDGLDELPVARQEVAVAALNAFQRDYHPPHLVVCCRIEEYENCSTKLELNGAIRLLPLLDEQIRDFLERGIGPTAWDSLNADAQLNDLARSPLFLQMIARAHHEVKAAEAQMTGSSTERRARLLDVHVQHLLAASQGAYDADRTRRWLATLARQMQALGRDDFLIERLQPDWLQSPRARLAYRTTVGCAAAAAFAAGLSLLTWPIDLLPASRLAQAAPFHETSVVYNRLFLALMAVGAATVIASQNSIRPVETLRWSTAAAIDTLRRWPVKAAAFGADYGFLVGLAAAPVVALINPSWPVGQGVVARAGQIVGFLVAVTALVGLARLPGVRQYLDGDRRLSRSQGRVWSALFVGLLYGPSWITDRTVVSIGLGALQAIGVFGLLAFSRSMDNALSARIAGAMVAGFVGVAGLIVGVLVTHSTKLSASDALALYPQVGTGFGITVAWLAALVGNKAWPSTDAQRPQLRAWARWLTAGVGLALVFFAGAMALSALGQAALIRSLLNLQIRIWAASGLVVGTAVFAAFSTGLMGAVLAGIGGVIVSLTSGIAGPDVEVRSRPNQGIRRSAINVGWFAAAGFVVIGLPYGLFNLGLSVLTTGLAPDLIDVIRLGLGGAALIGTASALVPGAACLQHYALRFVLSCQGSAPWRYSRFLDDATERLLLQRVGGRYRFMHVLLRDHFAAMAQDTGTRAAS